MKVVLTYDMGESFVEELRTAFPELDFCPAYGYGEAEQVQEVADAEIVFGLMKRPVFLAAKELKWFHFVGIGFDPIVRDIPEFRTGDVAMTNARETHVVPMADHVFAAILAHAHRNPRTARRPAQPPVEYQALCAAHHRIGRDQDGGAGDG